MVPALQRWCNNTGSDVAGCCLGKHSAQPLFDDRRGQATPVAQAGLHSEAGLGARDAVPSHRTGIGACGVRNRWGLQMLLRIAGLVPQSMGSWTAGITTAVRDLVFQWAGLAGLQPVKESANLLLLQHPDRHLPSRLGRVTCCSGLCRYGTPAAGDPGPNC